MERVTNFHFQGVISHGQSSRTKQWRRQGMSPHILWNFYHCAIKNILTGCITSLYALQPQSFAECGEVLWKDNWRWTSFPLLIYTGSCVWGKVEGLTKTPVTITTYSSYCRAEGIAVSGLEQQAEAFLLKPDCWTLSINTHRLFTVTCTPYCTYFTP